MIPTIIFTITRTMLRLHHIHVRLLPIPRTFSLLGFCSSIIFYLRHHSSLAVEILYSFEFHFLKKTSALVFMNGSLPSLVFIDLLIPQLYNSLLKIDESLIIFAL